MTKNKIRFTLKFKILLSVVAMTACAISANLYFSYNLLVDDKAAYIYETGLKKTESLSNRLLIKIKQSIQTAEFLRLIQQTNPKALRRVINKLENVLLFSSYSKNSEFTDNIFIPEAQTSSSKEKITTLIKALPLKKVLEKLIPIKKGLSYAPIYQLVNYPAIAILIKSEKKKLNLLSVIDISDISKEMIEDNIFSNYIVTNSGISLTSKNTPMFIQGIKTTDVSRGTKQLIKENGKKSLLSFTKSHGLKLIVASEIDRDKAFIITRILLEKSIYFGLALLGMFIFFGIIFSAQITKPIKILLEATKQIAKGNYSTEINTKSNDELNILSNSFVTMSKEIKGLLFEKEEMIDELTEAKAQLEDYSKNLEKKVEERTIELKRSNSFLGAMINSLDQGLVVFDKENKCNDVYTKATEDIFDTTPKDKSFPEVIGLTSEKEISTFEQWSNVLFSEQIPFSSAVGLGIKEMNYGENSKDENFKSVAIQYYPMRDENEAISNIVAVATDKTTEILNQEDLAATEAYSKMVLAITKNKKAFLNFLTETEEILERLYTVIDENGVFDIPLALMLFHSLNGGFGMYSVYELKEEAREIESMLVELNEDGSNEATEKFIPIFKKNLNNYVHIYKKFINECMVILGNDFREKSKTVELTLTNAKKLMIKINESNNDDLISLASDLLEKEHIIESFKQYDSLVESLAEKLGKDIGPIQYEGDHIRIHPAPYNEFFTSLVHLFRNCVDHGIESGHGRKELGKVPKGTIKIAFDDLESILRVTISDDGRGIDPAKIRAKLQENNPKENFDHIPDNEIIYKIFDPTFSTAETLTDVSGRGVGMSAILNTVNQLNGKIVVTSVINHGSKFEFNLPKLTMTN